jgi:hypothetical protein
MAELDKRIADLEAEIEGYKAEYKTASAEDIRMWAGLINSARETLNRLLDEKKAQSGGKYISCSSMFLNVISMLCCEFL